MCSQHFSECSTQLQVPCLRAKAVALIRKDPEKALVRFDEDWGQYEAICRREGMRVTWVTTVPTGIA